MQVMQPPVAADLPQRRSLVPAEGVDEVGGAVLPAICRRLCGSVEASWRRALQLKLQLNFMSRSPSPGMTPAAPLATIRQGTSSTWCSGTRRGHRGR